MIFYNLSKVVKIMFCYFYQMKYIFLNGLRTLP
jgi:hypothetical protein